MLGWQGERKNLYHWWHDCHHNHPQSCSIVELNGLWKNKSPCWFKTLLIQVFQYSLTSYCFHPVDKVLNFFHPSHSPLIGASILFKFLSLKRLPFKLFIILFLFPSCCKWGRWEALKIKRMINGEERLGVIVALYFNYI